MRVLVCGSRDWIDRESIEMLMRRIDGYPGPHTLVHGAARGADSIAAEIASDWGWEIAAFPADWNGQGRKAGVLRNLAMLDSGIDVCMAFKTREDSRGTNHTVKNALNRGIPCEIMTLPL